MTNRILITFLIICIHIFASCQVTSSEKNVINLIKKEYDSFIGKDSSEMRKSLRKIQPYFCQLNFYQSHTDISQDDVFNLINSYRENFKREYFQFVRFYSGCFSEDQYKSTRKYLEETMSFENIDYYLVGIFQLDKFRPILEDQIRDNWYEEIVTTLKKDWYNKSEAYKLLKEAKIYFTLANLGDKEIEFKLINILKSHYKYLNGSEFSSEFYRMKEMLFFFDTVVPKILGNINSKSSLLETLYFLENYKLVEFEASDVYTISMNQHYIEKVILPKIDVSYRNEFFLEVLASLIGTEELEEQNEIVNNLKSDIFNNKLNWSKLYNYTESK
ncbi:MAG: hypothetical protein AAF806_29105 [Bacteroidota bacterium]